MSTVSCLGGWCPVQDPGEGSAGSAGFENLDGAKGRKKAPNSMLIKEKGNIGAADIHINAAQLKEF